MKSSFVFLLLCGSLLWAQTVQRDAELFPDKTLSFISVSLGKDVDGQWEKTPFAAMLEEPEMRDFLSAVEEQLQVGKNWQVFARRFAAVFGIEIPHILRHLERCSMALINIPKGSEPIAFGMVVSFVPEFQGDAERLLRRTMEVLPIREEQYDHGKSKVYRLKGLENTIHYVKMPGRFLFATTAELIADMVDRVEGSKENSLARHPDFRDAQKFANPFFLVYLHTGGLLEQMWWHVPDEAREYLTTLGIKDWQSLTVSFDFDERGFFTRASLRLGSEPRGVNVLIPSQYLDAEMFRFIPQNSGAAMVSRLSLPLWWQEFQDCFAKIDRKMFRSFKEDLKKVERAFLEFSVAELAENLGPQFAVFHLPDRYPGLIPAWVAVAEIKDPAFIHKVLNNLAALGGYKFKSKIYEKHTIFYLAPDHEKREESYRERVRLNLSSDERAMLRALVGTFSFYVSDGKLVAAPLPQTLMDFIDFRLSGAPSLAMDSSKPESAVGNCTTLCYVDMRSFLPQLYQTFLPFVPPLEELSHYYFQLPVDAASFPRIGSITRHFTPLKLALTRDGLDFALTVRSNLGLEFTLPCIGTILAVDDSIGSPLIRFAEEFNEFLYIHEQSEKLKAQNRYYEASNYWQRLSERTRFEYFRRIADQNRERLLAGHREQNLATGRKLGELAPSEYLGQWDIHGDWIARDDHISAKTEDGIFWLISTREDLNQYVVELEVKDIENRLEIWCHWQRPENGDDYSSRSPNYQSISFKENKNLQGQWVTLKVKVKGSFISYWHGLEHYKIRSNSEHGYLGIAIPQGSSVRIRSIKVTEVKLPEREITATSELPSLHISCRDNFDPIAQGETVTYLLTLKNEGGIAAREVRIHATLADTLQHRQTLGKNLEWQSKGKTLESSPFNLNSGEDLKLEFHSRAVEKGAASIKIAVTFAGMQGEIVVSEYTLVR